MNVVFQLVIDDKLSSAKWWFGVHVLWSFFDDSSDNCNIIYNTKFLRMKRSYCDIYHERGHLDETHQQR